MAAGLVTFIYVHAIHIFLGEDALVTYSAINYVACLLVYMAVGVAQGCQPLLSYYNGSGENGNISKLLKYQFKTVAILEVLGVIIITAFRGPIIRIFITSGEALINYSASALIPFSAACLITGFNIVMSGYFTSLEKPGRGAAVSLGRCSYMLVVGIATCVTLFGADAIWYGMALGEVLTLVLAIVLYNGRNAAKVAGTSK